MSYPTPPSSTSSNLATSSAPLVKFDDYVHYAGKAAELAREAILQLPTLTSRIAQLEQELEYWKSNHEESSQRAKDAQRQLDSRETMVACFLDGDGCIFDRSLIRKGRDGGREAALALRSRIVDYAELQGLRGSLTIVITLFLSRTGLAKALQAYGLADETTFNAFLQGLNAAHPLIQVTDVGPQKEAADAKLRENVKLYSKLPSCKLVLAGCSHDGGYAHVFNTLQTESPSLFKKLRLLHSYASQDTAFELKRLNLESVRFEGLFEQRKLGTPTYSTIGTGTAPSPVLHRKSTPVSMVTSSNGGKKRSGYTSSNGNTSQPETFGSPVKPAQEKPVDRKPKLKAIDPTKPLNKQAEPLCNAHYLAPPCSSTVQGETCRYSHSYLLTSAQIDQLRIDARKSPCIFVLKGQKCKDGSACLHGHVCPRGDKCKYGKSCRFLAPGMHPPGTKGRSDVTKVATRNATTSDEDDVNFAQLTPSQSINANTTTSTLPATATMSKSQAKRRERTEARMAKYMVKFGVATGSGGGDASDVKDIGQGKGKVRRVEESDDDDGSDSESGYETTSSID
ncbi:hypothetical protein JCM3766R1_006783 [Sporobolomyces carnicolor]